MLRGYDRGSVVVPRDKTAGNVLSVGDLVKMQWEDRDGTDSYLVVESENDCCFTYFLQNMTGATTCFRTQKFSTLTELLDKIIDFDDAEADIYKATEYTFSLDEVDTVFDFDFDWDIEEEEEPQEPFDTAVANLKKAVKVFRECRCGYSCSDCPMSESVDHPQFDGDICDLTGVLHLAIN